MRLWDTYVNLREFNTSFSFFFPARFIESTHMQKLSVPAVVT